MEADVPLSTHLNFETAPISWAELERFFARGRVLNVAVELDLIDVAVALHEDNTTKFTTWIEEKKVNHLQDETAKSWHADDSDLWAVVIAPWVLVQNRRSVH